MSTHPATAPSTQVRPDPVGGFGGVLHCPDVLRPYVDAGVLGTADVHVAGTLCRLADCHDDLALLAAAMAVRAPGKGHSCLDVDTVAATVRDVDDPTELDWPDPDRWLAAVTASPLVDRDGTRAPLAVEGRRVFLRRYLDHERAVAEALRGRCVEVDGVDGDLLDATLGRLFPGADVDDPQRRAAALAVRSRLAVVAGGPGTGKTWTTARILAALAAQAVAAGDPMRVALLAPTGRAAARLDAGLQDALAQMDVDEDVRAVLVQVGRGRTIHGALGGGGGPRAWHHRGRPLPHDVVVVDEMSMAPVALASRLFDAVARRSRLVLVGDPDQLASVEAGTVLGDVVGPAGDAHAPVVEAHGPATTGVAETDVTLPDDHPLGRRVVRLQRVHRYGEDTGIGRLADATRRGDADAVVEVLRSSPDVTWHDALGDTASDEVQGLLVDRARRVVAAARAGDGPTALATLGEAVVLCAHRRGPDGVAGWNVRVDGWLGRAVDGWRPHTMWQPGRSVLVTGNDHQLGVYNGDVGVVVDTPGGLRVDVHGDASGRRPPIPLQRLEQVEPTHAMTIHKSQGSQWDHVVVVLPDAGSRILTRELLYTAVTRAARRITLIGTEAVVRAAVDTPIRRASGLRERLWGPGS